MTKIRAGKYRHKITFLKWVEIIKPSGAISNEWMPIYTPDNGEGNGLTEDEILAKSSSRAAIRPLRGREFWAAQQSQSEVQGTIEIRYRNDIKPSYRIQTSDGRTLEILNILNLEEKNEEMHIQYKEAQ